MNQFHNSNGWGIFRLWANWLSGSGAITLLVILSLWVRPLYMPFVAFGFQFILFLLIRHNRRSRIPSCYILPFVVSRVLFWTGIVMIVVNFIYTSHLAEGIFGASHINRDIPFICVLITSPIAAAISGWAYLHIHRCAFCLDCMMRNGTPAERGFLGRIYTQVGSYQVGMLFWLSAVSTILGWGYYALLYVNTSLTPPDKFVFFWVPALLWIFAAIYLAIRYIGIYGYYRQNVEGSLTRHGSYTLLRYIIIYNEKIAVLPPETSPDRQMQLDQKPDTPTSLHIARTDSLPLTTAEAYFANMSGIQASQPAEVRFMYANLVGNADCNILHYLVFLDTPEQVEALQTRFPALRWASMGDVASMINSHTLAPLMSSEIIRLHTIVMARKTYHPDGRRRYRLRHYRPTFRLSDARHLTDLDFNSSRWLYIARYNQDTPNYRLRRLWRKYVSGTDI